jgi:cytochrome oxidase Cu insertion factor (SCO1/SenC/PrrC family)
MPDGAVGMKTAAALFLMTCAAASAAAQPPVPRDTPPLEERLLDNSVPDIWLTTATGPRIRLSQISDRRPLVLTFVFTRCAGVCSPFLRSWLAADRRLGRQGQYSRLVLSFDPRDTVEDMSALARHLSLHENDDWTFAVSDPDDLRRLADALGFWWDWDEGRQQFDHPAMLAGIRDGRLARLLVGGSVSSARLEELVREASGEFIRSYPLPGRVAFRCVQFDAATGRMRLDWGFGLLLVPVAATSAGTFALFAAGARARRNTRRCSGLRATARPWSWQRRRCIPSKEDGCLPVPRKNSPGRR